MNHLYLKISVAAVFLASLFPVLSTAVEVPKFVADVESGKLPPLNERLPEIPRVINLSESGREIGRHGGDLHMIMGKTRDIRQMVIYGYARLVGYDRNLDLVADILESYEVLYVHTILFT